MCGEQETILSVPSDRVGSSPRVRGTGNNDHRRVSAPGIIPACAGNSCLGVAMWLSMRDHPRVCGEQPTTAETHRSTEGSSPRVRGTGTAAREPGSAVGIIPACAGNSAAWNEAILSGRDHPRVCGEQLSPTSRTELKEGSSPRVRGTDGWGDSLNVVTGIIPACAGNSLPILVINEISWDHPRVCGEQKERSASVSPFVGSSPRVRGTGYSYPSF